MSFDKQTLCDHEKHLHDISHRVDFLTRLARLSWIPDDCLTSLVPSQKLSTKGTAILGSGGCAATSFRGDCLTTLHRGQFDLHVTGLQERFREMDGVSGSTVRTAASQFPFSSGVGSRSGTSTRTYKLITLGVR